MKKFSVFVFTVLLILTVCFLCACAPKNVAEASNTKSPEKSTEETVTKPMDEAEQKLSTSLLQLVNDAFLPEGKTKEQILEEMKSEGQVKEFGPDKNVLGAYVYVQLEKDADIHLLDAYVLETANVDEASKLVLSTSISAG